MIRRSLNLEKRMRSCGMAMEPNLSLNPERLAGGACAPSARRRLA